MAIFWTAAALLVYTYAGYPLWIFLRALVRPRPWRRAPVFPTVSVILVVHNGAAGLQPKIDQLLDARLPARTPRADCRVRRLDRPDRADPAAEPPGARHSSPNRVGKCAALNAAMLRATGEILVFEDIRPAHDSAALRSLVSNFADPQVGCAAGEVILREDGHEPSARAVGPWAHPGATSSGFDGASRSSIRWRRVRGFTRCAAGSRCACRMSPSR